MNAEWRDRRGFISRRNFAADMLPTMKTSRARKPRIAIVGSGRLGTALAVSLQAAGYSIAEIVSRASAGSQRRAKTLARQVRGRTAIVGQSDLRGELVWICVPDGEIAGCANSLANARWEGKIALHSSGALTSDAIDVLRKRGASVASVHPMMTFVAGVPPSLSGVGFAVEGDREAIRSAKEIVARLGGESFLIARKDKSLYHAWGTLASPLMTALLASGEEVAGAAGISRSRARRWMLPIVRQTIENYAKHGAARGFSGPIIRGDVSTIKKHLRVLRRFPVAQEVYLALARSALRTLPARNQKGLKVLLG
jgi:predicted short-subunit dehydrogenase-like oxidoreductase (DUF2520 family)